jgi:hypothetical protein
MLATATSGTWGSGLLSPEHDPELLRGYPHGGHKVP